jgi:phi LC3 family holin
MINWKVRFRNKLWVTSLLSQTALMIQALLAGLVSLGLINISLEEVDHSIKIVLGLVNTVLVYLSFLGVVIDPTTKSISDSEKAKQYTEPK